MEADAINNAPQRQMPCTVLTGAVDSQSPDRSFAHANSTQSCRPREALLSSGTLCLKSGKLYFGYLLDQENIGLFAMRHLRLGLAVVGVVVSATAGVALWPRAHDAAAILAAQ